MKWNYYFRLEGRAAAILKNSKDTDILTVYDGETYFYTEENYPMFKYLRISYEEAQKILEKEKDISNYSKEELYYELLKIACKVFEEILKLEVTDLYFSSL